MRALLTATLLIAVAGCSGERKQADAVATPHAAGEAPTVQSRPANVAALPARADLRDAFASLPDRGELLAADPARRTQKHGGYTFEPVRISEAHALAAIAGHALVVDTPDGRQLRVAYAEHVDHGDGNWTWIGRDAQGQRALITFGERAVFGTIPDGNRGVLSITTDRNGGWLVQAGRGAGSARTHLAALTGRTDFRVPSAIALADAPRTQGTANAPISTAAATAGTGSVVDVVVGYTPGMLARHGNASAVITRIQSVIAYANDAYASSGIAHRVRLVRTVQVNHDDASLNDTALQQLTGDDGQGNAVPVPAELQPLRSAGVQYGADIIVLMRSFMRVQESCGIAWLLGGDGTRIEGSVDYAYGVVSDGYVDEGDRRYLCEESTLAHEMGHVMGQTHDTANTSGSGAHPYSYGYREAVDDPSYFYTIMAYGMDRQTGVAFFSTPLKTVSGRPLGVANQSDNARSMAQTMPIVAAFRAALARPRSDFDADAVSDILWRNVRTGANQVWRSANSATVRAVASVPNAAWAIADTGDFNGDGAADILWRNASTAQNQVWYSGLSASAAVLGNVPSTWTVAGVGDFNADGRSDILWRNAGTGQNSIWRSASVGASQSLASVPGSSGWAIAGVGDFNGDGAADILWRNNNTGANQIWRSGNAATVQTVTAIPNLQWKVAGVGDFNRDGAADILWRNATTGQSQLWRSGSSAQATVLGNAPEPWRVASVADFNGDGASDILWRNASTGAAVIWRSANINSGQAVTAVANMDWVVAR